MGAGSHGGARVGDRRVDRIARRGQNSSITTLGPGIGPWAGATGGHQTAMDAGWTGKGACTSSFGDPAGVAGHVGPEAVGGVDFGTRHGRKFRSILG